MDGYILARIGCVDLKAVGPTDECCAVGGGRAWVCACVRVCILYVYVECDVEKGAFTVWNNEKELFKFIIGFFFTKK